MNRHSLITILISACLFLFLTILYYTLYCYVYFNKNQIKIYIDNYNNKEYTYIYEHLTNRDKITSKEYYITINQTLDKEIIEEIYEEYYRNNIELTNFLKKHYYGDIEIDRKDITFNEIGKTTYGTRRTLEYESIKLEREDNYTNISILNNINIISNPNTKIKIDKNELEIDCNNSCKIDYILGGNHFIEIEDGNKEEILFVNINESNQEIDLINNPDIIITNEINEQPLESTVKTGLYHVSECYIKPNVYCPTKKKTYIEIRDNKTVYFHLYNGWEIAYTEYWGTYKIEKDFLIIDFIKHSYTPYDYDTGTYSTIEMNVPSSQKYKINGNTLTGEKYQIYYVGPIEE